MTRVDELIASLTDDRLREVLASGWTVSATLAHLAFWDRWVEARWNHFSRTGSFHDLPDDITDLVNAAAVEQWRALAPGESMRLCKEAAMSLTRRIERLSEPEIAAAVETGRLAMLDRTRHWYPHINEIER